jgi:chemotaxis protein MotB
VLIESQTADTGGNIREAQFWLPTYAALCAALLVFFVMHYSIKESSQAQVSKRAVAMQTHAFNDIRAFIAQNGLETDVEAVREQASITLRLSEGMLFLPEAEYILPTGFNTLNQLTDLFIVQHQQSINIRAYTDDSPLPPGTRLKDNWELSALRAAHILRHLLAQGIEPERLTAAGFGELEPLFPNTTEKNRAQNRRVEFVLERRPGKE